MEGWAVVACVASVVQLVDFTARCINKSVELHQSGDGVLESNAALEDVANHLRGLKDEVNVAATAVSDPALHDLCNSVTSTTEDLLGVLNKLKVKGPKSKWMSLRKAIRTVWSKEQIQDLERRLAGFRDELNLHVVVRLRQQLNNMDSDLQTLIQSSSGKTQEILDAVLNQRDIFAAQLDDHESQSIQLHQATKDLIQETNKDVRADIARHEADSNARNREEHDQTRELVQLESRRIEQQSEGLQETTVTAIQSSETTIVSSIEINSQANQADHAQTQSQIAELKTSVQILAEQIKARDEELMQLLTAFNETTSATKRKKIGEKSNAVTAALLALETMCSTLLSVLAILESSAKELLNHARTVEVWKITSYASKLTISTKTRAANQGSVGTAETLLLETTFSYDETRPLRQPALLLTSGFAHTNYFNSYYPSVTSSAHFLNGRAMEARWKFRPQTTERASVGIGYDGVRVDSGFCDSTSLWFMASITVVLNEYLAQETEAFSVLARALDAYSTGGTARQEIYSNGHFSGRLRADMKYWDSFARSRGLDAATDRAKTSLDKWPEIDQEELRQLLQWLVTSRYHSRRRMNEFVVETVTIRHHGPAWQIAEALKKKGLQLDWEDAIFFDAYIKKIPIRIHVTGPLNASIGHVTVYCPKCLGQTVNPEAAREYLLSMISI